MIQNLIFRFRILLFFWEYYFGVQLLYICPHVPVDIRVFFNFIFSSRKSQSQPKIFLTWQIFQKRVSVWCEEKHLHCTISWHSRTLLSKHFESIFLYISGKKISFQSHSKILSDWGGFGGRLNNFHKAACCLGLVKCFTIFHFNWNFWELNSFSAF